jgi:hypothetical protein
MNVYDSIDTAAKAMGAEIISFAHPTYPDKPFRGVICGRYVEVRSYRGVEGVPIGNYLIEGHTGLFVADATTGWKAVGPDGTLTTPTPPQKDHLASVETIEGSVTPHAAEEEPDEEPASKDFF